MKRGRAGEVVKSGRERERRSHMLRYIGLQKMDTYNNLTQDRVLYANLVQSSPCTEDMQM